MAALVCDICGGKLVMGTGGIAICDSCGMEHSADRVKEKIQEIKGTVQIDNSHMVDTWMKMGLSAAQAGNNREAYDYFTKIVEVDHNNWRAIYEKGKAGAWQSTLGNLRVSEIYQGINMALEIIAHLEMSDAERIEIKNEFAVALFSINNAITDLIEENLENIDDKYFDLHWDQMAEVRQRYITNVSQLEDALSLIIEQNDELSRSNIVEFKKRMCSDLRKACSPISYWDDFSQSSISYFGFRSSEKRKYLDKYWKLVEEIRDVEPEYATSQWSYPDPFDPGFHRSDECYRYWQTAESERRVEKEKKKRKERIDAYWAEHADEKKRFDERLFEIESEIGKLMEQVSKYDAKILEIKQETFQKTPLEEQLEEIRKQLLDLCKQKSKLGFFEGKQKKQIQGEIDILQSKINNMEEAIKEQREFAQKDIMLRIAEIEIERKPFVEKISALEKEKEEINCELIGHC